MSTQPKKSPLVVLVIDANSKQGATLDWKDIFSRAQQRRVDLAEKKANDETVAAVDYYNNNGLSDEDFFRLSAKYDLSVHQANWNDICITSYPDNPKGRRACIHIRARANPLNESQKRNRTVNPQLILIRALPYGLTNRWDHRNQLLGLIHSGIPCVNSAMSVWLNELERPFVYSGLKKIQDRLGPDAFPLINQYYYSSWSEMGFVPGPYPQVVKIAHMDAGMGKMKVNTEEEMKDLGTVVGIHGDYSTSENFLNGLYDLRIQKIGHRVRVFKRTGMSWKTNMDSLTIEEIDLQPRYLSWVEEASKMNGVEMDICTVDALVCEDGREYILEANGCSSGVPYLTEEQDYLSMADLCFQRLVDNYLEKDFNTEKERDFETATELAKLRNVVEELQIQVRSIEGGSNTYNTVRR
eukprot:TRINITY_DN995_c0_g1_i1.p1 TRINITY_DN995_c0_g1~~TRINITY_DN995_c0_g1_i1.p1  ORF type:complete len:411 (-),score=58.97 TRINITY_DN995_c0_g1_i1:250-1482(-)